MSHTNVTVRGMDLGENDLLNRLLLKLDNLAGYNLTREQLYEMKYMSPRLSEIMPQQYSHLGLSLGWIAKGVDGLSNRCNVRGFHHPDIDLEALGLSSFLDDNRALSELAMGRTSSLIHGPSFLVNTIGAEGEPASLLHARSALDATGDYNPRTRRMKNLISVLDRNDKGEPTEVALYVHNMTIVVKDMGRDGWEVTSRQEHEWGLPVEVLRYRPRERRPYGTSRITPASMSHQASAIRALARMEGHMDVYSWPEFWLLGADSSVFGNADRMKVMLGRIKYLPDDPEALDPALARADVKQFPASSPEPHIVQLNTLAKLQAREFNLPDSSFALTDYSNPTSEGSYVEGRDDLLADAETAMDEWSVPTRRAVRRGLAMANGDPELFEALADLQLSWRSPMHISRAAEADAGAKQMASAPDWLRETTVGLELLGLTDDQIKRALVEKRRLEGRTALSVAAGLAPSVEGEGTRDTKAKYDALGVAIRAGVSPESAAAALGLSGLDFTGAVPASLRVREDKTAELEPRGGG